MTRYAELHSVSNFSFLRGASHPEELINQAATLGYEALALTDECSLAGVVRAHVARRNLADADAGEPEPHPKFIIGSEIRLSESLDHVKHGAVKPRTAGRHDMHHKTGPRIVLLASNQRAYAQLSGLITRGRRAATKGQYRLGRADIQREAGDCLALLIPDPPEIADPMKTASWFCDVFKGRGWIAAELLLGPTDKRWLQHLQTLERHFGIPLVAAGDVHMHQRSRRALQDVLTSVRNGVSIQRAGKLLHPNGERHLRSLDHIASIYPADLVRRSADIAERCSFASWWSTSCPSFANSTMSVTF